MVSCPSGIEPRDPRDGVDSPEKGDFYTFRRRCLIPGMKSRPLNVGVSIILAGIFLWFELFCPLFWASNSVGDSF